MTLLAGAGLLVRSLARLTAVDPGFRTDHLGTFSVTQHYVTLARLALQRKARHYMVDTPHLIYLRKIKPRIG